VPGSQKWWDKMANLQFNPPANLLQPQDYSYIPRSVDQFFNAYYRAKQNTRDQQLFNQQQQLVQAQLENAQFQQLGNSLEFGGYKPQQFAPNEQQFAAANPLVQVPGPAQNGQLPMGSSGNLAGFDQDSAKRIGVLQSLLARKQQAQQTAAQESSAILSKTQAEADKARSDAAVNNMFTGGAGGLSVWAAQLRKDVEEGRVSPEQAFTESSRMGPNGLGRILVDKALSGLDLATLQAKQKGRESLQTGGAIPKANTQTLQSSLDVLEGLNNEAPRNSIQLINKLGLEVAAQRGDRYANRLIQQARVASDLFQSNFGAGSNDKLALAQELANPKQTTQQLADTIRLIKADMANRVSAYEGKQGTAKPVFDGASAGNGSVRVQTPDGKIWNLPSDKLDAALARGAKKL
jgi:hypothetical protein